MAEYTDLSCGSPEIAAMVNGYLLRELAQEEDAPNITAYVEKSTLRITYHDVITSAERQGWDMQLIGFRDGLEFKEHS